MAELGFFDDIRDVGNTLKDAGNAVKDPIKNQVTSTFKAIAAPAGLVWDLSTMPFDGKDDNFGTVVDKFARRGGDVVEPLLSPDTAAGIMLRKAGHSLAWAYEEGVDHPLATVQLAQANLAYNIQRDGIMPSVRELVDPGAWSEAYREAEDMSAGQAAVVAQNNAGGLAASLLGGDPNGMVDPMGGDPYGEMHDNLQRQGTGGNVLSKLASTSRWTYDITAMIGADPTAGGLKAVGAVRAVRGLHSLNILERANSGRLMATGEDIRHGLRIPRPSAKNRVEPFFEWIDGKNALGKPLKGAEIRWTPELRQYTSEPEKVAGLLGEAGEIVKREERWDMFRRILAVASGDTQAVDRFAAERVTSTPALMDKIKNISNGHVVNAEALAHAPELAQNPRFIHHIQSQIDNLNTDKAITKHIDDWNSQIDYVIGNKANDVTTVSGKGVEQTIPDVGIQGSMTHLPGAHAKADRALRREHDMGKGRIGKRVDERIDEGAQRVAAARASSSTVFQKGLWSPPLLVIRTAGHIASPYTKWPVAISDSLRTSHFTGTVNLQDWGQGLNQLDSAMKTFYVPAAERSSILSKVMTAKNEAERTSATAFVESRVMQALADHHGAKVGQVIEPEYIEEMMLKHAGKRAMGTNTILARAYGATESQGDLAARQVALREKNIESAQGAAAAAAGGGKASASVGEWVPRVDQFVDDLGSPVALPLLETQLANYLPMMDFHLADKLLSREYSRMARASRAWKAQTEEIRVLETMKGKALEHGIKSQADKLDTAIERRRVMADWLMHYGQVLNRGWKFSVLFRLGYPIRVVAEENLRILAHIGAGGTMMNIKEGASNARSNAGRLQRAKAEQEIARSRRNELRAELGSSEMASYPDRLAKLKRIESMLSANKGARTRFSNRGAAGEDMDARVAEKDRRIADLEREREYLANKLGDSTPEGIQEEIDQLEDFLRMDPKKLRGEKKRVGSRPVVMPDGTIYDPAMNDVYRTLSSSHNTFDAQLNRIEENTYKSLSQGDWTTVAADQPGHLGIWTDVLNHQFGKSQVAQFFLKGGTRDEFAAWIKKPEQASLRRRVPHYAAEPEDWATRVEQLVYDYAPTQDLRDRILAGTVTRKWLGKNFPETKNRPAVHGEVVAHNLGTDRVSEAAGRFFNGIYRRLGEMPTDRLSRHPYFAAMYERRVADHHEVLKASKAQKGDTKFTQDDLDRVTQMARRDALADVRRTLFDISAHSNAAHTLRFISPFFAAHQESLQRWWKIAADNPAAIRRFQQAFDLPRHAGITVDEDGNPVKPGDPISNKHKILLPKWMAPEGEQWSINENSFNIILPGGLTNPGVGPLVSVPADYLARTYADDPAVARVAEMLNPYPQDSPLASAFPATLRRMLAYSHGKGGPDVLGVGASEFNATLEREATDLYVKFERENGRLPTEGERDEIMEHARNEALSTSARRILWNFTSPTPARPESKYAAQQAIWWKTWEYAKAHGHDRAWANERFREKVGDGYLALTSSSNRNPARLEGSPVEVKATKRYQDLLQKVDPSLHRMVTGHYADQFLDTLSPAKRKEYEERSPTAVKWFENESIDGVSEDTYMSREDPIKAMTEMQARRGWQQYDELTSALVEMAQGAGLSSYQESPELVELKKQGTQKLLAENDAFARDFEQRDSGRFDGLLTDIRKIASSSKYQGDLERTDIGTLQNYLEIRDYFVELFKWRQDNGLGGVDAQASEPLRLIYTQVIGQLVESNTYFANYAYNGTIEFDPLLIDQEGQ